MAKRILIVDDEPDIVVLMKFMLENNGFVVITAYDGEDGLRKAQFYKPDLIMLDVLMPKMLGDDMALQLKSYSECKDIPIIFFTNIPDDFLSGRRHSKDAAYPDADKKIYLSKSCSEEELLSAIEQVLTA